MQKCALATDGYTIILGHIGTFAVNPFVFDKLPIDTNRDFKPISLLAKVPSLYVVSANLPVKNLKEFVALAKSKPGQLNYGSAGNGSAGHLAFEYLKIAADIFVLHVPYRGTGPQLTTCRPADWTPPALVRRPSWRTSSQASYAASSPELLIRPFEI